MIGVLESPVAMISSAIRRAEFTGIANPRPIDPASPVNVGANVAMAEFTPITCPALFSSGPPEFPGLIAASVCSALM